MQDLDFGITAQTRDGLLDPVFELTIVSLYLPKAFMVICSRGGGGGGGGALGYLGGCIRSLSKLKNTPKALFSGQKSTLILIKR